MVSHPLYQMQRVLMHRHNCEKKKNHQKSLYAEYSSIIKLINLNWKNKSIFT